MKNIKLIVSYNGTNYNGWQRQPKNKGIGVQNVLEEALTKLCGEEISINGAGRTDTGVHALGQCANFKTNSTIPATSYKEALKQYLPEDIKVLESEEMSDDFHPRFSPHLTEYQYVVALDGANVFNKDYVWDLGRSRIKDVDLEKLQKACDLFLGEHDFSSYCGTGTSVTNFTRTIDKCQVELIENKDKRVVLDYGRTLVFTIRGNGFLYKQVRLMVGVLIMYLRNKRTYEDILASINEPKGIIAPPAPAGGLVMKEIKYL